MEILYADGSVLVCIKPAGVLSTDEPGGLPGLVREALGDARADVRTVHRLDRAVSGLMVLARSAEAAAELSRQIREGSFEKEYLAVVHGYPPAQAALRDLMFRDKARKMSFIADAPGKGVQEARLSFETQGRGEELSLLRIRLETGRTHQIRVQLASRGWPLWGERKYAPPCDDGPLALFSHMLAFTHPETGESLRFEKEPPACPPWTLVKNKTGDCAANACNAATLEL
ncbi:MAG: RluA family pseudouridine synthase [Oscillospiraceae bacterium]|nr:RluA family pseudouridine synthase [Oscillospiraceae bacterium]